MEKYNIDIHLAEIGKIKQIFAMIPQYDIIPILVDPQYTSGYISY